ncbi:MAG: nucleotidyltransferase domain-containing protein [Desulfobulbaceae bacterium]
MAQIDTVVLDRVRSFLKKIDQAGISVSHAYIFGSHARGQADEWSDIDIAIVSPNIGPDRFEERIRLTEIAINIDDRLEPLPFSSDNFNDGDPLVRNIKKEGIPVT